MTLHTEGEGAARGGAELPRGTPDTARGELFVIVASPSDAAVLAPLGRADARESVSVPIALVATGPDPMEVDLALDDAGTPAARVLLLDGPCGGPAGEAARLLPRLDEMLADAAPAGVIVHGGSVAALVTAQCAAWRGVPVLHVPQVGLSGVGGANQAAVAELAAWQTSPEGGLPYPTELDLLVHRRLEPGRTDTLVGLPGGRGGSPRPATGVSA